MQNDLQKAITTARKAIHDQHIPPMTLLGKSLFGSLDKAQAALRCGDRETVQRELDQINGLLQD